MKSTGIPRWIRAYVRKFRIRLSELGIRSLALGLAHLRLHERGSLIIRLRGRATPCSLHDALPYVPGTMRRKRKSSGAAAHNTSAVLVVDLSSPRAHFHFPSRIHFFLNYICASQQCALSVTSVLSSIFLVSPSNFRREEAQ